MKFFDWCFTLCRSWGDSRTIRTGLGFFTAGSAVVRSTLLFL